MVRSHVTALPFLLCGLVACLVGCSSSDAFEDDQGEVELQQDAKLDAAFSVVGTWANDAPANGELALLELRSNKAFLLRYADSASADSGSDEEGVYKITRSNSGKTKYLRLTQSGVLLVRYAFVIGAAGLQLRDTATGQTFVLTRRPAGTARLGTPSFVPSADGMECQMNTVHCVANDLSGCPLVQPLPPDFCANGKVVKGEDRFVAGSGGFECVMPSVHCVTKDLARCPQLSPLPPDFCADGTVVKGADRYVPASDGMECALPSIHCVTKDGDACPLVQPLPPDFCAA